MFRQWLPLSRAVTPRWGRWPLVLMVGAHLVVAAWGLPVALPQPMAQPGASFPCEGGRCGCKTASHCWTRCCCTTPAERLAWAKRQGITPPPSLQTAARQAEGKQPAGSCCAGGAVQRVTKKPPCYSSSKNVSSRTPRQERVSLIAAARCRGLGEWWIAGGEPLGTGSVPVAAPRSVMVTLVLPWGTAWLGSVADAPPSRPG